MKKTFTYILAILILTFPNIAFSQAGTIDKSFGNNGIVTTYKVIDYYYSTCSVLQNDGKILVGGNTYINMKNDLTDFAILRYNLNGTLDSSFNLIGKSILKIGTSHDNLTSIAIQQDGKIIVAGYSHVNDSELTLVLVRFNLNGTLDSTFGNYGIVKSQYGKNGDFLYSIVLQQDGKIIVAGKSNIYNFDNYEYKFALTRYTPNGNIDSSFGKNGKIITIIGYEAIGYAVKLQSNGKIILVGSSKKGYYEKLNFTIARYNNDGILDSTFGKDGVTITSIGDVGDEISSVSILNDDKIIVAGTSFKFNGKSYDHEIALAKYNSNGTLDRTFGENGVIITPINGLSDLTNNSMVIQKNGKILLTGSSYNDSTKVIFLLRYNINGKLDITFGNKGIVLTQIGTKAGGTSINLQKDEKIIVAGYTNINGDIESIIVRYNNYITDVEETPSYSKSSIEISPNPFSAQTVLKLPEFITSGSLSVFNMFGQEVLRQENISGESITLKRENLPVGVYMMQISKANEIVAMDKLIIVD